MKKILMLLAVASFSTAVMAQEETTPVLKDGFVMNSKNKKVLIYQVINKQCNV